MESLPGGWDIPRPNIGSWYPDLGVLPPSSMMNDFRSRLFNLGPRFEKLTQGTGPDDDIEEPIVARPSRTRNQPTAGPNEDEALYMVNVVAVSKLPSS